MSAQIFGLFLNICDEMCKQESGTLVACMIFLPSHRIVLHGQTIAMPIQGSIQSPPEWPSRNTSILPVVVLQTCSKACPVQASKGIYRHTALAPGWSTQRQQRGSTHDMFAGPWHCANSRWVGGRVEGEHSWEGGQSGGGTFSNLQHWIQISMSDHVAQHRGNYFS